MKSVCLLTTAVLALTAARSAEVDLHSGLKPGETLTVKRLTKDVAATTLEKNSVYYLAGDLELTGRTSASPSEPGAAALSLPADGTVYIYIPSNKTLTCTGGAGCPAAPGGAQQKPQWYKQEHSLNGIAHDGAEFTQAPGGKGGAGASGGGPGILVPSNSTLVVFGEGMLRAQGGAGGAAAVPTNSLAEAGYAVANWCCMEGKDISSPDYAKTYSENNLNLDVNWRGTSKDDVASVCWNFQSVSGGGGCGGGGGGGAAIGTAGGFGGLGAPGATQKNVWSWTDYAVAVVKAEEQPESGRSSVAAGTVYIALPEKNYTLKGGDGGTAKSPPSWTVSTNEVKFTFFYWYWGEHKTYTNRLYRISGGAGGAGGAGTQGAPIGTGGGGGGGGRGGDTGACTCELTQEGAKAAIPAGVNVTPRCGDLGGLGAGATPKGASTMRNPDDYPYSTVTLKDIAQTEKYYFSLGTKIDLPASKSSFVTSWGLAKAAKELEGVPNTSSAFLLNGPTDYWPPTEVTVGVSTYGDVELTNRVLKVRTAAGDVPIVIDSGFFSKYLSKYGSIAEMAKFMNSVGQNGLKVWQDYVLGLNHTDGNAAIRIAAESRPDGQTGVRIRPIKQLTPRTGTGFSVSYRLAGPGAEPGDPVLSQAFDVDLPKSGGRYRLGVLIKADSVENAADVIPAANEVGVLCVTNEESNTIVGVPFAGYDGGPTTVSNLLPATAVPANTELFCCVDGKGKYERWTADVRSWTARNAFTVGKDGTNELARSESADTRQVANGTGLWLTRKSEKDNPICLFGSVPANGAPTAPVKTTVPKGTSVLVANPLETGMSPQITNAAEGDTIQLAISAGPLRTYRYANGKWVCWVNGAPTVTALPLVRPGTGFWYVSTGTDLEVEISWK